jgi:hypothetical protein
MRPADNIEKSIKKLRYKTDAETHEKVLGNVLQTLDKREKQKSGVIKPDIRRTIMKNTFTKIAAAIVVIAGILIGLHFAGNPFVATVTFADVIQPILSARTASLDIIIGSQGNQPVIHDDVMGSRIRRTFPNMQTPDIIIDFEQQRLLTIDHAKKTAAYVGLDGLSDLKNYIEVLQNTITILQSEPDFQVENRGTEELDGQDYLVFVASSINDTVTVWADPKTALPVRIEHMTPNMVIACDNLQFDVLFDESLFSMEAPDGYAVQDAGGIDLSDSSENAFIETLRIWAEIIEDGHFPDSINLEDVVKVGPKFGHGMKRAGLTEEQQAEVAMRWGQGLVFIRFFKGQGQWHYAGQGVKLGDGDKPIFWYQPQDSDTWRVIYGDLHVENMKEEYLPSPELSDRQVRFLKASEQWENQEFVGTEKDLWHVTASGKIVAHSHITLTQMPQGADSMYIKLPYAGGMLESVILNNTELSFNELIQGRYELELPADVALENLEIECIWSMPLETLTKVDYGYRINLQGLIPVEGFVLTIVLEPDCGLEYTKDPSQSRIVPFRGAEFSRITMDLGSCGLLVQKRN